MLNQPIASEKKNILSISPRGGKSSVNKSLHCFFFNNFMPSWLTKYPEFEKQLSEFLSSHRMSLKTKQILTTTTKWRHKNDYFKKDEECLELVFYYQAPPEVSLQAKRWSGIETCSLSNFAVEFINQITTYHVQVFGKPLLFDDQNHLPHGGDDILESTTQRLGMYFRGYTGSVSDFYIVNPPDFIKPIAVVGNTKYIENRDVQRDPKQKEILDKIRFTITHQNPQVPIIYGQAGQFKSIYEITLKCCQLEHEYLDPPLRGNSQVITANLRANHRLSAYFKHILFLDNPIRKRKSRSQSGLRRNKPRQDSHHCRGWTASVL